MTFVQGQGRGPNSQWHARAWGSRALLRRKAQPDYRSAHRCLPQVRYSEPLGARYDQVIALTFDDGPDRQYTPQILDILRDKGVRATFFVIGAAATLNRNILHRIYLEGHDIGNHTFTHVNSAEASVERLKIELNATQRLFEATLGIHTRLFRPPYARDIEPQTIDGTEALRLASSLGYVTIGMNIDPKDWYRPMAEQIVHDTVEGAINHRGNVVLLHDAGGMRSSHRRSTASNH